MIDDLELIGTGFVAVLAVLALIWGACALVGAYFIRAAARVAPAPAPMAAPQPVAAEGVPPHHLAAIATAVATVMGPGYRVNRVLAPAHQTDNWPLEGRLATFITGHATHTDWGKILPMPAPPVTGNPRGKS